MLFIHGAGLQKYNQEVRMTALIDTPAKFIEELESFLDTFGYNSEQLRENGCIERSIAEGLELRAKRLHQVAVEVLPDGKNKDQILRHLAWCHQDARTSAVLFAAA
jgi:hypothetical protein